MSHGGPSVMEMDSYQMPTSSVQTSDYPGESVSGDTTVLGRDYRANSVDYFKNQDSNGGTVVSYATSGYRSNAPDIDFDDKQGDAYESIERFQDRRVVATPKGSGNCPPPSKMPELRKPGQFDMPDYVTKKGWVSLRKCLCFFIFLSLVTLLVAIVGAAVGVYAFLSVFEGGRIVGVSSSGMGSSTNDAVITMLQTQLDESQSLIDELRADLSVQINSFEALSLQVAPLIDIAHTANATNGTEVNSGFSFDNCQTTIQSSCIVDHDSAFPGTTPYIGCDTFEMPLEQDGVFVADIYCSIDNRGGEVNPVSSTLDIFDGKASCSCTVIHVTTPVADITCNLNVKTCPM